MIAYNTEFKHKRLNNLFCLTKTNVDFVNSIQTDKDKYSLQFIDNENYNINDIVNIDNDPNYFSNFSFI